jgi:hypothetical protein
VAQQKNNKVVKYRRKPKAAGFIFAIILIYIICFIVMYFSKSKVQTYEVESGSLTTNTSFTGIAMRTEQVFYSQYSGDINYYQRENTKVKSSDIVYTVDETGRVSDILSQYSTTGENSLSKQSLADIKSMLNHFKTSYDGGNFSDIYDLKADINSTVLQAMNESIMNNLESIIESTGSHDLFQTVQAGTSGIVVYSVDGYENLSDTDITSDDFDKDKYTKQNLKSESLVVAGNPVYKLVTSEDWYILIPLTKEQIEQFDLNSKSSVTIKFKKDNITTSAGFQLVTNDDNIYGKLSLDRYMIRYASERLLDIELVFASKTGLKIPVSAVTESDFYTVPKEYLTSGGNSSSDGFICEKYDDNGQLVTSFEEADIYKTTDTLYYISCNDFDKGTILVKPDSSDRYVLGSIDRLKGVYCVNTGYTVFELVEIIDENNEYYVVKQGLTHGISAYDHILLNAEKYSENEMIY